ncbi:MAG: hypothetical protein ACREQY_14265, partial [Candidatus Binatia bacterium]
LYALVEPLARRGIEATSLEIGLTQLAAGILAPETLDLTLHRKPELIATSSQRPGFLLRLEGRRATVQTFDLDSGYAPERTLVLSESELAQLASALARHSPSRFPANLWAPDYNDLAIELLGHAVSVQARGFSRMTASTHGEVQRHFDAVAELLARLGERVVAAGESLPEG